MQSTTTMPRATVRLRPWALLGKAEPSLFEALFPSARWAHKLAAAAFLIAVTAGLARVRFFFPDNPVPVTLQTFGVLMTGAVLGWRWGFISIAGYYMLGMSGAPVFQGGGNGWKYVTGATGGYLIGFILATYVVGYLTQHGWSRGRALWPIVLGAIAVYLPALVWLSVFDLGWPKAGKLWSSAVYPFVPGDLLKMVAAGLAAGLLWRIADWLRDRRGQDTNTSAS
ncbi:MAG: biotin transporter BioY [Dehalococcoidia bacterium]|nr:biotin transporter BioY [Dehalococcoidia bacterium]MSQ35020.1 biotin transporter BioY [Dehalococcoidia bacterium]